MNAPSISAEERTAAQAETFYGGAIERVARFTLVLVIPGAVGAFLWKGWEGALGAALGGVLSWHNFRVLARAVNGLADRITAGASRERGGRIVWRFLGRYLWVAAAGYAIFNVSLAGFYGFMLGLCLPAAAMMCEAAWEAWTALHRGI
jgi:hypothetical protein